MPVNSLATYSANFGGFFERHHRQIERVNEAVGLRVRAGEQWLRDLVKRVPGVPVGDCFTVQVEDLANVVKALCRCSSVEQVEPQIPVSVIGLRCLDAVDLKIFESAAEIAWLIVLGESEPFDCPQVVRAQAGNPVLIGGSRR